MRALELEFFTGTRKPGVNEIVHLRKTEKSAFLLALEARQRELAQRAEFERTQAEALRKAESDAFFAQTREPKIPVPDNVCKRGIRRERE
jgi:hypothetical protein